MKKIILVLAVITPLIFMGFTIETNQSKVLTSQNFCSLTYSQGYDVGKSIGSSETYYEENIEMYGNTLRDYAHCSDYVAGVIDGYYAYRLPYPTPPSTDPCPSCDCIFEPEGCIGDDIQ